MEDWQEGSGDPGRTMGFSCPIHQQKVSSFLVLTILSCKPLSILSLRAPIPTSHLDTGPGALNPVGSEQWSWAPADYSQQFLLGSGPQGRVLLS